MRVEVSGWWVANQLLQSLPRRRGRARSVTNSGSCRNIHNLVSIHSALSSPSSHLATGRQLANLHSRMNADRAPGLLHAVVTFSQNGKTGRCLQFVLLNVSAWSVQCHVLQRGTLQMNRPYGIHVIYIHNAYSTYTSTKRFSPPGLRFAQNFFHLGHCLLSTGQQLQAIPFYALLHSRFLCPFIHRVLQN